MVSYFFGVIKQYMVLFNDTILILNWADGNKVGVEITNASFAEMYKQIFWKFWEIAEGYIEEGKKIEKAKKTEAPIVPSAETYVLSYIIKT
jgi:hypothetical protein